MKTEELKTKIYGILHDELSADCVGNGVTNCTWTVMGKAKVVDLVLAEIEAAERRRTEEIVALIKRHSKAVRNDSKATPENARHSLDTQAWVLDQTAKSIRSKFLKNPEL